MTRQVGLAGSVENDPQATCSIRTWCAAQSRHNVRSERWQWADYFDEIMPKSLGRHREPPLHWLVITLNLPFADRAIRPNAELSANACLSDMKRHSLLSAA
jgi:hypothetical protein